jgi:hypothetical protein
MQVIAANIQKRSISKSRLLAVSFFLILLLPFSQLKSQSSDTGSTEIRKDTNKVVVVIKKHPPKKALLMSAVLPGLGQAYNKKYWKIPIIYAGAAAVTYFAIKNLDSLNIYSSAYKKSVTGKSALIDKFHSQYDSTQLLTLRTDYKRYTDLTFIIAGAIYALNIIDATVDAYMFTYDLSDDLSMHVLPTFYTSRNYSYTGLSFSFTFGKHSKPPLLHKE